MITRAATLILAAVLSSAAISGCASTSDRASTGQSIDDTVITTKIKAKLVDDPDTKAYQIHVETFKGTVQLSGFVESATARSRAGSIAKETAGVKSVKNSLEIRKSAS